MEKRNEKMMEESGKRRGGGWLEELKNFKSLGKQWTYEGRGRKGT